MRIHRLLVEHLRGVTHREIRFPESGVVVIAGPNEIGKSTLVDALDLLLTERDSSTKAAIRALQPVGRDVGSVVEAELTIGPVRVVYRKQWNRGAATHLTILGSPPEHLTGRPAHERLSTLLAEHLDLDLYRAQRVLQSRGDSWSAAHTLTTALDAAAGRAVAQEAGESLLAAVETEYRLLHTTTGRPTGAWRDLLDRRVTAEQIAVQARAALHRVDEAAAAQAAATEQVRVLAGDLAAHTAERDALRDRHARRAAAATRLDQAATATAAAAVRRSAADHLRRERVAAVDRVAALATALTQASDESERLASALAPAQTAATDRAAEIEQLDRDVAAAEQRARVARDRADRLADLVELHELEAAAAAVTAAEQTVTRARTGLAAAPFGPVQWARLEQAERAVALAEVAADSSAAHLDVEWLDPAHTLTLDGTVVSPVRGQAVTQDLVVEIGAVARLRLRPAVGADESVRALGQARRHLADLLAAAGVEDLAAARRLADRHRTAAADLDRAVAAAAEVTRERPLDELLVRIAEVRGRLGMEPADSGVPGGGAGDAELSEVAERTQLRSARTAARDADRDAELARAGRRAAAKAREGADEHLHRLGRDHASARTSVAALTDQHRGAARTLADARAEHPDDELSARLVQAQVEVDEARTIADRARTEHAAVADPGLDAALAAAEAAVAAGHLAGETAERALLTCAAELEVLGAQGLQDSADLAETALVEVTRQLADLTRRAEAVALLREVLLRHRDQARARYLEPFRAAIVRCGRLWLGPTFDVTVGEDLQVRTRSLDGTTVDVAVLSTGAKEQLSVLIRLATADLVAGPDGVPVVFDDALGFTDPDRTAALGPAFSRTTDAQILLLTCDPDRYRALPGATVLLLHPEGVVTRAGPSVRPGRPPRAGRRPPDRAEFALFEPEDMADDPVITTLLHPLRTTSGPSSRTRRSG